VAAYRRSPGHVRLGHRRETIVVGGRFAFEELNSEMLLDVLPPVLHLNGQTVSGRVLQAAVDMLDHETATRQLGAGIVTHHVAQIMLVHALRAVVSGPDHGPLGWLGGLADARIGKALLAIHKEAPQRWTVELLAQRAGMSRSQFAQRFKELVGPSPLEYLRQFRIRCAALALRSGTRNVSSIAFDMGYESESAFTNAFKRAMGLPPRDYRARFAPARAVPAAPGPQ
jgi:transcriptional regulator GlxA family with amidase domain